MVLPVYTPNMTAAQKKAARDAADRAYRRVKAEGGKQPSKGGFFKKLKGSSKPSANSWLRTLGTRKTPLRKLVGPGGPLHDPAPPKKAPRKLIGEPVHSKRTFTPRVVHPTGGERIPTPRPRPKYPTGATAERIREEERKQLQKVDYQTPHKRKSYWVPVPKFHPPGPNYEEAEEDRPNVVYPPRTSKRKKNRVSTGKKKYDQAAYLSGLGMNPNIKRNKGIYKPYANGGGVRKPKYNKKG